MASREGQKFTAGFAAANAAKATPPSVSFPAPRKYGSTCGERVGRQRRGEGSTRVCSLARTALTTSERFAEGTFPSRMFKAWYQPMLSRGQERWRSVRKKKECTLPSLFFYRPRGAISFWSEYPLPSARDAAPNDDHIDFGHVFFNYERRRRRTTTKVNTIYTCCCDKIKSFPTEPEQSFCRFRS